MPFLRALRLDRSSSLPETYPFTIPAIASLESLQFTAPVTFLAGGNGSGKSTFLEAVAEAAGSIPVRSQDAGTARTLAPIAPLAQRLKLTWTSRSGRGFFLRAEDFFEYKKHLVDAVADMDALDADYRSRFTGQALGLASGVAHGQREALVQRYGEDMNALSHGESFLHFFSARFTGAGLYLIDEPDTALSTTSVLALMALLKEMVGEGAQFIIATHSPVLLAFPGATLLSFDRVPVAPVRYDDLEQVTLLREFLKAPGAFVRHL